VDVAGLRLKGRNGGVDAEDEHALVRAHIGEALAVDAHGQRWPVPVECTPAGLRWTVPAEVMESAAYPLALDPLIGPELGVATPLLDAAYGVEDSPRRCSWGTTCWWCGTRRETLPARAWMRRACCWTRCPFQFLVHPMRSWARGGRVGQPGPGGVE
jgi:hypothetical protein